MLTEESNFWICIRIKNWKEELLSLALLPGTRADEDSSQHGLMTNFIIEKTNDLYENYLDEIRSNSDEAQNLTISIIIDEIKKQMNGLF